VSDRGHRLIVSCLHCLRPVALVKHVSDVDIARLRAHLLLHYTGKPLPRGAEETLRHFTFAPEPPDGVKA